MVARAVVNLRVVWRKNERRLPVEPVSRPAGSPWSNETAFAGLQVNPAHRTVLALEVDLIFVLRIDQHDETIAAAYTVPIVIRRTGIVADPSRPAPTTVVLQAAVDVVVVVRTNADVIELPNGHVIVVVPVLATIPGHIDATIVAKNDMAAVLRVYPHRVVVDVNASPCSITVECFSAIVGLVQRCPKDPDMVAI